MTGGNTWKFWSTCRVCGLCGSRTLLERGRNNTWDGAFPEGYIDMPAPLGFNTSADYWDVDADLPRNEQMRSQEESTLVDHPFVALQ